MRKSMETATCQSVQGVGCPQGTLESEQAQELPSTAFDLQT